MDKITELETRGAALKAELAEYRQRFRTRSISLELKRTARQYPSAWEFQEPLPQSEARRGVGP